MFSSWRVVATVWVGERGPNMAKLKVLYGELNEETLTAQAESLQKAGYQVQPALGRKGVQDSLNSGTFDLVILGPTLTRDDRHHLPYMVKKSQKTTKVLVMHTDGSRHPYVDGNIDTGEDMQHLLAKIAAVTGAKAAAAAVGGR
jgi:DNA-binding response OmpR family regulator